MCFFSKSKMTCFFTLSPHVFYTQESW
uniref:Uncharacterized protein n=1 Tax=Anguilla anguilla TaxID=7936 RepID=A0A0E9UWX8_ANGAN